MLHQWIASLFGISFSQHKSIHRIGCFVVHTLSMPIATSAWESNCSSSSWVLWIDIDRWDLPWQKAWRAWHCWMTLDVEQLTRNKAVLERFSFNHLFRHFTYYRVFMNHVCLVWGQFDFSPPLNMIHAFTLWITTGQEVLLSVSSYCVQWSCWRAHFLSVEATRVRASLWE